MLLILLLITLSILSACSDNDNSGMPTPTVVSSLSISDLTVMEGNTDKSVEFEVNLTGTSRTENVSVSFDTRNGTAEKGTDFNLVSQGDLVFTPNDNKKTIEVSIVGDEIAEPEENFEVFLFNPTNATLSKDTGTGTIQDDDQNTGGNNFGIPDTGYVSPESYDGMTLAWSDEFDGNSLNPDNWTFEMGDGCPNLCGWGNNELEFYRPQNTTVTDGFLVVEAKEESFGGKNYTSSRMLTKGKQEFKFGRIDIRAALPEGQGLWPALWMLGANIDTVGWPASGEIDIMELTGDLPGRVLGTAHFGVNFNAHQYKTGTQMLEGDAKFSEEFHVFSINWKPDLIQWLIDDQVFHEFTPNDTGVQPYPFNKPFYFIFNLAVGGNLPGSPDATTVFPQRLIVDYIRVFQE